MMIVDTSPKTLRGQQMKGEPCQIIDLRESDEFQQCHIPGSINVPLSKFDQEYGRIDASKVAYFICNTDEQEETAVLELARLGDKHSCILRGGIQEWKRAGLPLEGTLQHNCERHLPAAAGTLMLLGLALSFFNPAWLILSALVAIDLIHLSMTGSCTLGKALMRRTGNTTTQT